MSAAGNLGLENLVTGFTGFARPVASLQKLSSAELFCKQLPRGEINIHTALGSVW